MLKERPSREASPQTYKPDDSKPKSKWSKLHPFQGNAPGILILTDLSHYPAWKPQAKAYIERWEQDGRNVVFCRDKLLEIICNAEPFQDLASPEDIFAAVEFSYEHCLVQMSCRISLQPKDLCRYSCCWYCESASVAIDALVKELAVTLILRPEVSIYRETEGYLVEDGEIHWFVVSIGWYEAAGGQQRRAFNLALGSDDIRDIREMFHHVSENKSNLAKAWLEQCRTRHHCGVDRVFIPKRLVFVGDDNSMPHLIEPSHESKGLDYAALSYCWGAQVGSFTTTFANIEANKQALPLDKLSKTIQDALHVCRKLGLPYLWVDALCIIQDEGHIDWDEQSGQMRQIYSQAQLTIAAHDTPTSTGGFWLWDPRGLQRRQDRCWVQPLPEQTKDVLSTRGWALQERILSHRVLSISSTGISWECDEHGRSETGESQIGFLGLSFRAFRLLTREEQGLRLDDDRDASTHITEFLTTGSWQSISFAWDSIVENYSTKKLTQVSDKLSAISGLASFVLNYRQLSAESYLAGLWKGNLAEGLLWCVSEPGPALPRDLYIAPSWSWASVSGSIKYFHERYQFQFQPTLSIKEATCSALPADPTGKVTSGAIHLQGMLRRVNVVVVPNSRECNSKYVALTDGESQTLTFVRPPLPQNGIADSDESRWYEVMCDVHRDVTPQHLGHEHHDGCFSGKESNGNCSLQNPSDEGVHYFCLSVGEMVDSFTGGRRHWFLLLEYVGGSQHTYRRVGIGYFQYLRRQFPMFDFCSSQAVTLV